MGQKTQYQMKLKQRQKRIKRRKRITAKGQNLNDYFYNKYYLKSAA